MTPAVVTPNTGKVPTPVLDASSGTITTDISTADVDAYFIWIHWKNSFGTEIFSEPILIRIKYNCTYDVITHSIYAPNGDDNPPDEMSFLFENINNIKPNIHMNFTAGEHQFLPVNVSSRIHNNASEHCPLYDFVITKLVDAVTGQ